MTKLCTCKSGLCRYALIDARGFFVNYVCAACVERVKAKYRPDIFTDSQYWCDEDVEEAE